MRAQAKLAGVPRQALFGESCFVLRTNAEKWAADARAEVWDYVHESRKEETAALERIAQDRADGKPSPFAHLAGWGEAIQKSLKNSQQYKIDPAGCDADWLEEHRRIETISSLYKLCEASGVDFGTAFPPGSLASPARMEMAQRIVAGANRNGAVVDLAERRNK